MLQTTVDVTGGGPLALAVTFLLAVVFYALTLHLAATFFIGDVPTQYAARAAVVPAVVSFVLQQWGPAVTIVATLFSDFVAVTWSYDLRWRGAAVLTLLHFAFFVALFVPLNNVLGIVS
jgi:hypothetical protein